MVAREGQGGDQRSKSEIVEFVCNCIASASKSTYSMAVDKQQSSTHLIWHPMDFALLARVHTESLTSDMTAPRLTR